MSPLRVRARRNEPEKDCLSVPQKGSRVKYHIGIHTLRLLRLIRPEVGMSTGVLPFTGFRFQGLGFRL